MGHALGQLYSRRLQGVYSCCIALLFMRRYQLLGAVGNPSERKTMNECSLLWFGLPNVPIYLAQGRGREDS